MHLPPSRRKNNFLNTASERKEKKMATESRGGYGACRRAWCWSSSPEGGLSPHLTAAAPPAPISCPRSHRAAPDLAPPPPSTAPSSPRPKGARFSLDQPPWGNKPRRRRWWCAWWAHRRSSVRGGGEGTLCLRRRSGRFVEGRRVRGMRWRIRVWCAVEVEQGGSGRRGKWSCRAGAGVGWAEEEDGLVRKF
jgi:hypothetical protein